MVIYKWLTLERLLIAVVVVLLTSYAITLKISNLSHQSDLDALKQAQTEALDNEELALNTLKENYRDTIKTKDAKIDSFDVALSLKDIQLNNIHNDVQILAGDSIGILDALNRIYSK